MAVSPGAGADQAAGCDNRSMLSGWHGRIERELKANRQNNVVKLKTLAVSHKREGLREAVLRQHQASTRSVQLERSETAFGSPTVPQNQRDTLTELTSGARGRRFESCQAHQLQVLKGIALPFDWCNALRSFCCPGKRCSFTGARFNFETRPLGEAHVSLCHNSTFSLGVRLFRARGATRPGHGGGLGDPQGTAGVDIAPGTSALRHLLLVPQLAPLAPRTSSEPANYL